MKNSMTPSMMSLAVLALMASLAVTGCGGGSSSDSSTPAPTTQEPGKLMLSGVVATQTVQANATVVAKCAVGGGAVTAAADGKYSLSFDKALLPCVLEADLLDGTRLHSVAYGASGATTATANITPVTELVVANLAGSSPSQFYTNFTATSVPLVTSARANASVASVNTALAVLNVDASVVGNPITAALVPAGTSATVNTYGQVLVQINTALVTAGTTLAQLTTTEATTGAAPHLPAELLNQPQASNCAALRSGYYRFVWFMPSQTGAPGDFSSINRIYFDSQSLNAKDDTGAVVKTFTQNGACRYKGVSPGGGGLMDWVMSPAGVSVGVSAVDGQMRVGVGFPEQVLPLAELAGAYNFISIESGGAGQPVAGHGLTMKLGLMGNIESGGCYPDNIMVRTCTMGVGPFPKIVSHPSGGFSMSSIDPADPWTDRWFAYRAGSGDLMLMWVGQGGVFGLGTPQLPTSLPAAGSSGRAWAVSGDMNRVVNSTIDELFYATKSVDQATSSYVSTRRNLLLATDDSHDEPIQVNWPRTGYNHRAAGSAVAANGTAVNMPEWINMVLRGTGMSMTYTPPTSTQAASYSISVDQ